MRIIASAACAALMTAAPCLAQPPQFPDPVTPRLGDIDHDGIVTPAERDRLKTPNDVRRPNRSPAPLQISIIDLDQNGAISAAEWRAARTRASAPARAAFDKAFAALDRNQDGVLSAAEFSADNG